MDVAKVKSVMQKPGYVQSDSTPSVFTNLSINFIPFSNSAYNNTASVSYSVSEDGYLYTFLHLFCAQEAEIWPRF